MASKSLHESSSLTESVKQERVSNLQRQAKSHYTVKVGGKKNYADSDFVKPHESHAQLNLSHVLIADEPESEILANDFTEQASVSETVIPKGTTLPTSASSSDDEETIITQTDSENPILEFQKDDQGDGAAKFPTSTTNEVTDSLSNSSINTNRSDTVDTASWSSISSIEENLPLPDDNPPPASEQSNPPEPEPESRSPARNIFALFRTGLMAARRGAVMEPKEKPDDERSSSSGDDVDSISSAVQDKGDLEVKKSAVAVADLVKESVEDDDASVLVEGKGSVEGAPKKESSAEMQRLDSGDIVDDIKEAMLVQQGSSTGVGGNNEELDEDGVDTIEQVQPGESVKSSDTALSELFETVTEDLDGFVTAEALPDVTQEELVEESETDNPQASYADVVKGMVTQQAGDQDGQDGSQTQDKQGIKDIVQDKRKLVPPTGSIQSRGFTKSDSSVEVIPDVKVVKKETSSLDGLAIAEERESRESNNMQQDTDEETSEEIRDLKNELRRSRDETLTLRKQLDVQVMCEEYVRNEAREEIEKAGRKISRLQAQLDKPPKLIHKHRKELRRIFDEIQSAGGPSNLGTTTEGLQQAIRHLYWKKKDVAMLLYETEQRLQLLQTECEAWKRRSKEQEAAKEQLMTDYEQQQSNKTKISWNTSHSKSDTCLPFRDMKMTQSDISDNVSEQCMSRQNLAEMVESLKSQNYKLKRKLLDIQSEAQKQKLDTTEVKSQADLLKSKLDVMNDELIQERLHSQHLLTKLHSHELTAKNSKLLSLVDKLDEVGQPIEEAVSPTTGLGDVAGLEEWLGHLKAGQQQMRTELDRYKDKVEDLQNELTTAYQQQNQLNEPSTTTSEQNGVADKNVQAINEVKELKLWQELHQLRDVQLETVRDLEDKEYKISELQRRYSELLAEQLQQRTKLELDLEDNRSEKQQIQDRFEEMQQLVSELHRKCLQLSQALEEAQGRLANQDKTITDLNDQFAVTMATKEEEYSKKDAENERQRQLLESRLQQLEADTKGMTLSEKTLRAQLSTLMEENRLLHKQKSKSSVSDEKLDAIHNELAEIREAEEQFRGKYNLQDKEIHHLHNHVNVLQTGMRQQVQEMINSALSGWKKDKLLLESQLTKAVAALDNSEQSRKATEDVNKILIKNASDLEEGCKTLTTQLEMQHMGHQKTVDKLQHMKDLLGGEQQNKIQPEQDHDDLIDWEHQLKEEAHRLSTQLHRIMGTHDAQVRAMREANARLVNSLNMSPQTMHSYHDSVSSARAKLQLLLNSTRPKSAMPRLHHNDYMSGVSLPHRNPYTQAQGLTTNLEETRTMSGPFVRGHHPATFSSYAAESSPLLSFMNGH